MKKFLLSFLVIIASVIYVLFQHVGNGQNYPSALSSSGVSAGNNTPTNSTISYKDGEYVGQTADAYYGNIQVKAVIKGGKINDVQFLDYPQDRNTSVAINTDAMPILKTEAITSQNARVEIVSGATDTSQAFEKSLSSALAQASVSP